jgi:hypothetical protein
VAVDGGLQIDLADSVEDMRVSRGGDQGVSLGAWMVTAIDPEAVTLPHLVFRSGRGKVELLPSKAGSVPH